MQHHAGPAEQHRKTMLVFSQLQFGVLQTFLTAKKQREEKDQESEIEPGEVNDRDFRNGFNSNNMASLPALFLGHGGRVGLQESDNYS